MKTARFLLLFFSFSLGLFFSGCLDCERVSLSIDLMNKVTEIKYVNIVSDAKDEATIKKDFRGLLKMVYLDDDSKVEPDRITSKRLYKNNEQLDGVTRFSFKDLQTVLKEFNIEKDRDGPYLMDVTKEIGNYHVSSNGQYVERETKKWFKWDSHAKEIKVEMKSKTFVEAQNTRLLQYWLDWVEKNMKE